MSLPVGSIRVRSVRGAAEIRTRDGGFADLCLTTWLRRHGERSMALGFSEPGRNRRNIVTFRKTKGKHFRCKDLQPADPEVPRPDHQEIRKSGRNSVRDSRGCCIEALELIVHKIDAGGSLWVQGQETLGLDQSLAIELSGGPRVGIHQGTKALGELGRKRLIVGPGAANHFIPEIERRSDGLAAGKVREPAHRDRLDRPPDTRAAFGGWNAQQPVQQTLLVARMQQGVSHQLIENRLERGGELFAIDLDQDRLPVLEFLNRLARRVTWCRRILFVAEATDRGGKAPLQPGLLIRAVIERLFLAGDLVCGPVAADGKRGLIGPGGDAALAGASTVLAELIERVTQIDQSPGPAEQLMLSLP